MKIRDLLNLKDFKYRVVITVKPDETILAVIKKLIEHDRGSFAVCNDKGELVGIITERDILRKCFTRRDKLDQMLVQDVMTTRVAIGIPEDDLDYAIDIMKKKRIRHLPIVDEGKVVGMISMRDLLGVQYEETKAEIRYAGLLSKRPRLG
jgi:CBS domain-containing protein